MGIRMDPQAKQRRALRRKWLRAGGYWADLCRTKNGKPVYRWVYVRKRPARVRGCDCRACRPTILGDMRMILCPICGNKRCPKATDHRNACTRSNEPGQPGSAY